MRANLISLFLKRGAFYNFFNNKTIINIFFFSSEPPPFCAVGYKLRAPKSVPLIKDFPKRETGVEILILNHIKWEQKRFFPAFSFKRPRLKSRNFIRLFISVRHCKNQFPGLITEKNMFFQEQF